MPGDYDLAAEYAAARNASARERVILALVSVAFALPGIGLLNIGLSHGDNLAVVGSMFILCAAGVAVWSLYRTGLEARAVHVTESSIVVTLNSGRRVIEWTDPRLGFALAESNPVDPSKKGTLYTLSTGTDWGGGKGPALKVSISHACFLDILQMAGSLRLSKTETHQANQVYTNSIQKFSVGTDRGSPDRLARGAA